MRFTVAFDVDDTLIKQDSRGEDVPNYPVINLLLQLHALGAKISCGLVEGSSILHAGLRNWA